MTLEKKSAPPLNNIKLEELSIEATDEQMAELLRKVKQRGIEKEGLLTE
jgi:hypothetical protein